MPEIALAFPISGVFSGFDPENLTVGAVATATGAAGIALGSIIDAAIVALAFGITALVVPMRFNQVPSQVVVVPIVAVLLLAGLAVDGQFSRSNGMILLSGFVVALFYLVRPSWHGLAIRFTRKDIHRDAPVSGFRAPLPGLHRAETHCQLYSQFPRVVAAQR